MTKNSSNRKIMMNNTGITLRYLKQHGVINFQMKHQKGKVKGLSQDDYGFGSRQEFAKRSWFKLSKVWFRSDESEVSADN